MPNTPTINIPALPEHIMKDIREYVQDNIDEKATDSNILANYSADELFCYWCNWNGFINFSENIKAALDSIRKAKA